MSTDIFPSRWPAKNPNIVQLYSLPTPNGQKIGVMLEEIGIEYEPHLINIMEGDQFDPEYVEINPNSKIPSLIDPNGPGGKPIRLMESGAILMYLAEKTGKFLPTDPAQRLDVMQWLFFQVGSVGPFFGQFGHFFKFAKGKTDDYGEKRYTKETNRLLGVLDKRLAAQPYLVGDEYSIADIATFPWINALDFYGGKEVVEYASFEHVQAWIERCMARPAVARGIKVPATPGR